MNTIFKHKILTGAMLIGALFLTTSCEDSDESVVTPETPYADKTLYEVINADPELSDFVEVLNSCGSECADSLFNCSRVYTLWAPTNGTFNKDSIIAEVQAGNRDHVFRTFIMAHIANHLNPANGKLDEDNKILLLNSKVAVFSGDGVNYTFANSELVERNIRVWNGLLHKIGTPAEYRYSIWEFLKMDARIDSVSNFLYSYNVTEFDPGKSIIGPIKDGVQTYLDSVYTTTNALLNSYSGVGNIDLEDSLYVVYVPTNDVWNQMLAQAQKHFKYNLTAAKPVSMDSAYRDSLSNFYPRLNIVKYMAFSEYEQRYVNSPDSIVPANRDHYPRPLFAREQLEKNVVFTKELSNGIFKIIDQPSYNMFDLWHDTIKVQGEDDVMRESPSQGGIDYIIGVNQNNINKDSLLKDTKLAGGTYFASESSASAVIVKYKVPRVLSASYKVAIVVVPKHITNSAVDPAELKPTCFGIQVFQNSKLLYTVSDQLNDPTRVDTLYLTKTDGSPLVVTFPYCEYFTNTYSRDDFNVEFTITSKRNPKKYDPSVRIDEILFVPVSDQE